MFGMSSTLCLGSAWGRAGGLEKGKGREDRMEPSLPDSSQHIILILVEARSESWLINVQEIAVAICWLVSVLLMLS